MKTATKTSAMASAAVANEVGVRMQMEMVVREDVIIPFGPDGAGSLGIMLDRHLAGLAKEGGEPRSFSFSFDDASWKQAKPLYEAMADTGFLSTQEENLRYAVEDHKRNSQN